MKQLCSHKYVVPSQISYNEDGKINEVIIEASYLLAQADVVTKAFMEKHELNVNDLKIFLTFNHDEGCVMQFFRGDE